MLQKNKYDYKDTKFPTPYKKSESELLSDTCKEAEIECSIDIVPDSEPADGQFFTADPDLTSSEVDTDEISKTIKQILWEAYERANFLSSIYCLYMALMIFVGGPYVITSTRITTRIRKELNKLTKIWFVAVLLIIWYLSELLGLFWGLLIDANIFIVLRFALIDPCFADGSFISELVQNAAEICKDVLYSQSLYEASRSNLMYYESVEKTYNEYYYADKDYIFLNQGKDIRYTYNNDSDRMFYQSDTMLGRRYGLYDNFGNINSTQCAMSYVIRHIGPSDDVAVTVDGVYLFITAIFALLLQPVLANLIKTVFVLYDPLSPYWGRVEIPYEQNAEFLVEEEFNVEYKASNDGLDEFEAGVLNEIQDDRKKERIQQIKIMQEEELEKIIKFVKKWERTKNFCPLCCWIVLLILILISLFGASFM